MTGQRRLADDRVPHPDGRPFFGGTYFPQRGRHGMPGFSELLRRGRPTRGTNRRDDLEGQADELAEAIAARDARDCVADADVARQRRRLARPCARRPCRATFDREWGGFGDAPKFPQR